MTEPVMRTSPIAAAIVVAFLLAETPACGQILNPFISATLAPQPEIFDAPAAPVEGETPPNVVIERVVAFPRGDNATDVVVLRNVGGQTANLTGWVLEDAGQRSAAAHRFGEPEGCEGNATIPPSQKLELTPLSEENPCGFAFSISFRDEIKLKNENGSLVANVSWDSAVEGTSIRRLADGAYLQANETADVFGVLESLGNYTVFLQALKLMAPDDRAFDRFRALLAGPGNKPLEVNDILELPELLQILLYHIIPGGWSSEHLRNNTGIFTAQGVEIVPFVDGAMTEGKIMMHESCVDKPTPDIYECFEQVEFGKCHDPFMVSPLGAQWHGGFCQRTCERCRCDRSSRDFCAEVTMPDIVASNGFIHGVGRVLLPPPHFKKDPLAFAAAPSAEIDAPGRGVDADMDIAALLDNIPTAPPPPVASGGRRSGPSLAAVSNHGVQPQVAPVGFGVAPPSPARNPRVGASTGTGNKS